MNGNASENLNSLPPSTHIGRVYLRVRDLEACEQFYTGALGLERLGKGDGVVLLGAGGRVLLGLINAPGAAPAGRSPGLYHTAFLLPSREGLSRFLSHAVRTNVRLDGASDHAVSEAVYLSDPEGNGVEIYRDRNEAEWRYRDGKVDMITAPLDARSLLEAAEPTSEPYEAPARTTIGHVHLRVSDVKRARERYSDLLGFPVTHDGYPGALFLAAGGYHHHIGLNSWATTGAGPRPDDAAGLAWFEVVVPETAARDALKERLEGASPAVRVEREGVNASVHRDADGIGVAVVGE